MIENSLLYCHELVIVTIESLILDYTSSIQYQDHSLYPTIIVISPSGVSPTELTSHHK
jgi:hypothetical protein